MDDEVRTVLRQLVQSEGEGFYADPARVESRLRERVGDRPAQVDALVTAARAGVVEELQDVKPGLFDVAVGHLTGRMVRMHDADPDAARWAVESWAEALGAGVHGGQPESIAGMPTPRGPSLFAIGGFYQAGAGNVNHTAAWVGWWPSNSCWRVLTLPLRIASASRPRPKPLPVWITQTSCPSTRSANTRGAPTSA